MNVNFFEYCEDFRELSLNINDDRKIKINLIELIKAGTPGDMILLTVRCFDLKKSPPRKGEFDRAWYRLINEDTNQTIDYQNIKQVEKPEGFDEDATVASEEAEPASSPSITYIAGRIFLDKNNRWVYESYNQAFTSDKHPTLIEKLAEIHQTGEEEVKFQKNELQRCKEQLTELHEERRLAAVAAAAKKKPGKKGSKEARKQEEEEEPVKEELPLILKDQEPKNYDIFRPLDYIEILKEKIPRPFIFGPVDFTDIDNNSEPFPVDFWHETIIESLMRSPYLPADNILIHGFHITAKGRRTFKRASTIVHHSRFLKNLQVFPMGPPEGGLEMMDDGMEGYDDDMDG